MRKTIKEERTVQVGKRGLRTGHRTVLLATMAAFALGSTACSIQTETILAMDPGSGMVLSIPPFPAQDMPLEGGTVMNIDVTIGLFDILFGNIDGDVGVGELLFAVPPFKFLGQDALFTEELCVVPLEGSPSGGTFEADLKHNTATFDVTLSTIVLIGNEALAATLPGGGFIFPFHLVDTIPMSLGDMLGMLTGSGDLTVSQTLDQDVTLEVDLGGPSPLVLDANISGTLSLSGTDAFPTSPLLDDCIAFLNE